MPLLRLGLDVPLFTRLLEAGAARVMLTLQYRMHPAISAFPSGRVGGGVV